MSQTAPAASRKRRVVTVVLAIAVVAGVAFAWQPARRFWRIYRPAQQDLPLPTALWAIETGAGTAVTTRNAADADLAPLRAAFETQVYGSYCGVASAVIALKVLGRKGTTQSGFFVPATEAVRKAKDVFFGGMTLDQLGGLLRSHGATTTVVHASDSSVDAFRTEARANVESGGGPGGDVLLVNYYRKAIAQQGGGHISPVAAYDDKTDRFLVLDVSSYKYPPVWIETAALFTAMTAVDSSANLSRGWVHVRLPGAS